MTDSTLPGAVTAWEHLGTGHRCETWLAWSPQLWCPVVVKFPRAEQAAHPRARQTLRREVAALAGNLHPGLPRLYEDGTGAPLPYVLTEHVDGPALDEALADDGALDPLDTALLAIALLSALRAVHGRGLVHVDVKPDNVVLRDGRPVLIDFGSARAVGRPQPAGSLIGSPGYAAPELEAGDPIAVGNDVYGLGTVLYEALAGEPAFDPDVPAQQRPDPAPLPPSATADLVAALLDPRADRRPTVDGALAAFGAAAAERGAAPWPATVSLSPPAGGRAPTARPTCGR